MSYAENTSVPVARSRAEIETLIMKYGGSAFASGWNATEASVQFVARDRMVRFKLRLPDPNDKKFTRLRDQSWRSVTKEQAKKRYEQECRRLWRALLLSIKAKLECVDSGIETFEEAFLAHIVLPSGGTVADAALPQIEASYKNVGSPRPLLLGPGGSNV